MITIACRFRQGLAINNGDPAPLIIDHACVSEFESDTSNAWTINSERPGNLLVRETKSVLSAQLMDKQQPSTKPLFDRVIHVTNGSLRDLPNVVL